MRVPSIVMGGLLFLAAFGTAAQSGDPHEEDRKVLRGLLADIEEALNRKDTVAFGTYLHPNAVVTYQNGEVSRGIQEAEAFYQRMVAPPNPIVQDFSTRATLSSPAQFYADVAVAHGTTAERYVLTEGLEFSLDARWTATAVKHEGQWKVAALHFSSNLFDNPVLRGTQRLAWWAGGGGLAVGILLTLGLTRIARRLAADAP